MMGLLFGKSRVDYYSHLPVIRDRHGCNFCEKKKNNILMTKPRADWEVEVCEDCVSRAKDSLGFIECEGQK